VVLLSDFDLTVVDRLEDRGGYRVVRNTQLVLDCLAGNGRLPAEGGALLDWESRHGGLWRYPHNDQVELRAQVYRG